MERKDHYTHLILKHLAGETQPAEGQALRTWQAAHPDHQRWFEKVRATWQAAPGESREAQRAYQRLAHRLRFSDASLISPQANMRHQIGKYVAHHRIAAVSSVLLLLAAFVYYLVFRSPITHYQTGYGETATVVLPDSSVVTLNANSSLSYQVSDQREVWLEGEAFFHVKKVPLHQPAQRFVVHTAQVDVEVLGTRFNVNNRRGKATVVLNSGQVKLKSRMHQKEALVMKPGELVEVSAKRPQFVKKAVDPQQSSAWTNQRLVMDNTPLSDIAPTIADYYGLSMRFETPELAGTTLTGSIAMNELDLFLRVLAASANVQIRKNGKTLIVTRKGDP